MTTRPKRPRRVTVREVSEHSGVSIGTVSNVLNSPEVVAAETRARVQAAIAELGYQPSTAARNLKSRRSFMIAYPIYTSGFASIMGEFFRELVVTAADHGLGVTTVAVGESGHEPVFSRLLEAQAVDGFVLSEVIEDDPRIGWLLERDVPFTAFGRAGIDRDHDWVDLDITSGMLRLARHVLETGHTRLAYVGWDGQPTNRFRQDGVAAALAEQGLALPVSWALQTDFSADGGREAGLALLAQDPAPTAILCGHDIIAAGVLRAAHELGRHVGPEDLVITGFDDTAIARATTPSLTSVRFPLAEVAQHLVTRLVEQLDGRPVQPNVLLDCELVVRASSAGGAS